MRPTPWLVLFAALTLVACQGPPPRATQEAPDLGSLAAEALELGQYARAAELYRRALETDSEGLPLHFGLAIAASHLDLRDEAVREFRWVLARGEEGSEPVETARRWLASVGALPRSAPPAPADATAATPAPVEAEPAAKPASLAGRALLDDPSGQVKPMQRLKLYLIEHPSRVAFHDLRTDEEGRFRFDNVKPGAYMLTTRIVGEPLWRLRVDLKPGQEAALELTPANSLRVRDDFPG